MKTAAKVFIIIGMVFQFYMIFPIVFGVIILKKLNKAQKPEDISTLWKVLTLLLVNIIGGILLFCLKDTDFAPVAAVEAPATEE